MKRAQVGLALGSGAARGFAHIGVLKALTEHHIPIDAIAGSSMGSLIGSLYAAGIPPAYMEALACDLKWRHWADFTVPKMGLMSGTRVRELVALLTQERQIEQLPIRLAIVATDLLRKEGATFTSGSIADAVRASISIPGVFVPFVLDDTLYVDGGVLNRVPIRAAYNLGVNFVIAVDVAASHTAFRPDSIIDVIIQSLDVMQEGVATDHNVQANITIFPELSEIGPSHFSKAKKAIDAGYEAAQQVIHKVINLLLEAKYEVEEGTQNVFFNERDRQTQRGSSR